MSIQWKPVAVSALLAFIIVVVTAGISGVPFGVLLFRAVLGALIFGAGALGVQYLVAKFLPELVESGDGVDSSNGAPEAGGSVDIVISDDDDELEEEVDETEASDGPPEFEPGMPAATAPDDGEFAASGQDTGDVPADDGEPLVEVVEEAELENEPASEPDSEAETASAPEAESEPEEVAVAGNESVDTLPDVGEFTDSFMADAAQEEPPQDTARTTDDGQDPESIAKAIRTLMKREES